MPINNSNTFRSLKVSSSVWEEDSVQHIIELVFLKTQSTYEEIVRLADHDGLRSLLCDDLVLLLHRSFDWFKKTEANKLLGRPKRDLKAHDIVSIFHGLALVFGYQIREHCLRRQDEI